MKKLALVLTVVVMTVFIIGCDGINGTLDRFNDTLDRVDHYDDDYHNEVDGSHEDDKEPDKEGEDPDDGNNGIGNGSIQLPQTLPGESPLFDTVQSYFASVDLTDENIYWPLSDIDRGSAPGMTIGAFTGRYKDPAYWTDITSEISLETLAVITEMCRTMPTYNSRWGGTLDGSSRIGSFRIQPLEWRFLDTATGLIVYESVKSITASADPWHTAE
jgi:hypothetical protein